MYKSIVLFVLLGLLLLGHGAFAQDLKTTVRENKELDSLRKKLDDGKDSVIFTSKYIRYTTLRLTRDSIQTLPLDTSLRNFQNYSVLNQPRRPTLNTGAPGMAAQSLLFEPSKTIGFDPGFHSFDIYAMGPEDIIYYQARTQFSNLYYVSGGPEQVFRATHSQNIKRNLNVGANYFQIGSKGIYNNQKANDLNTSLFTWYQSPNKRYNLWATAIFNGFKAGENGTVNNDNLFVTVPGIQKVSHEAEPVHLSTAKQRWKKNVFYLKQSYFIGRIDTVEQPVMKKVLPTNKVTYEVSYDTQSFAFSKGENDDHYALPKGLIDTVATNDSTSVKHVRNEFIYSFFLRGKSRAFIKNELKIDLGIRHDYYKYNQAARYADLTNYYNYSSTFQNSTLLGALGYRFSDRMDLNVDLQQIFQGRQFGDFLYEAKSNIRLSNAAGRVVLGAYIQNKSPEEVFNRYFGNHYNWINNFDRTKTINLSFNYVNDKYKFEAGAKYYLINKYLYFAQVGTTPEIAPEQEAGSINLLKITVAKKLNFEKFHMDTYVVYQKTDSKSILRTPEVYVFNSFYRNQTFFKVLKTDVGFDVRYNTSYDAYGYSPAASQFYAMTNGPKLKTEPVVDVWVRASLRKANLFLKYDYVNQGLFSQGYYGVYKYPMPDRMLKFGVSWNFYD